MSYKNNLLLCSLLASMPGHALDQQFFSVKHTEYTPYMDDDGVLFPKDSVEFNTSSYRELLYASPDNKKFGIQLSALLNDNNEFDQMRAIFNWGGIVMVAGSGSIEGDFKQTAEARLPGQQKPDELFQTMLPAKQKFRVKMNFSPLACSKMMEALLALPIANIPSQYY